MAALETSSSANSSKNRTDFTMNGIPVEEWEARRISGPLSKKEFLTYLRKIGKLPPEGEQAKAA